MDFTVFCSFQGLDGCFQNLTELRCELFALQSLSDGCTDELLCSISWRGWWHVAGPVPAAGQCRSPGARGRLLRVPRLMARRALGEYNSTDRPVAVPCVPWHCFVPWHRRRLCPLVPCAACDSSTIVGRPPRAACDAPHRHLLPCASPSAAQICSCFLQKSRGQTLPFRRWRVRLLLEESSHGAVISLGERSIIESQNGLGWKGALKLI